MTFAGRDEAAQGAAMRIVEALGHEDGERCAHGLGRGEAEQPLGALAEVGDHPRSVR